jgi:hypothetical protein
MIHLKLYGLPRTGTNIAAYNIMKTWPGLVRVWHNNGPEDPDGENYWKHGEIKEVPGIDGYILCCRSWYENEQWKESFTEYLEKKTVCIDPRWIEMLGDGWWSEMASLGTKNKKSYLCVTGKPWGQLTGMEGLLKDVENRHGFPGPKKYHIDARRMNRCGDATPLEKYPTNEIYVPR